MNGLDVFRFAARALRGYPLRSSLTLAAMAIGVASVILLTSLGEGARIYVDREFRALGTNLLIVLPGRSETTGGPPPLLGETPRDLTLEDALALARSPAVAKVAPVAFGTAPVSFGSREREVAILGTTSSMLEIRHLVMGPGRSLPAGDPRRASPVCVLGGTVAEELAGGRAILGRQVRVGDRRFRVIGLLSSEGQSLGLDLDDMVLVPVASAMTLFDTASLFRVLAEARSGAEIEAARRAIRETIRRRHEGEDDVTVITQDSVLSTFDEIIGALTLSVGGIAAISLGIAGILIMNVLLISVSERRSEIGLLKALGAPPGQIVLLFLSEAIVLALAGALIGLAVGAAGIEVIARIYPSFPVTPPAWAPAASVGLALGAGAVFGALPAWRAAGLDPVLALSRR